ncbi:4923_t:CDS:2 [Diversispora eburnea]|uniref:histone acetyltransferase n=1 Tax=Diversispora eburnea TaxID=1213867 RepID=A0A9N9BYQ0_9GLOM|nr:4923_t:CDS:2 [Diversispora eburnea]
MSSLNGSSMLKSNHHNKAKRKIESEDEEDYTRPTARISMKRPIGCVKEESEKNVKKQDVSSSLHAHEQPSKVQELLEMEHVRYTKVRNIDVVVFGKYEIETWYYSPFPDEYKNVKKIYVCQHCLKYMKVKETYGRHMSLCDRRYPTGVKIYEKGRNKIYEVDGKLQKVFVTKIFLDHKTIYYDVESFLFYILVEIDDRNEEHVVGYFSKEKISYDNYNLACILILPPYQRRGYGQMLIELSYELSKKEHKIGTPERPISDLGMKGYKSYWKRTILRILQNHTPPPKPTINGLSNGPHGSQSQQLDGNEKFMISITEISQKTSIRQDDVIYVLHEMGFLKYRNPKVGSVDINNTIVINHDPINPIIIFDGDSQLQSREDEYTQNIEERNIVCVTRRMIDDYIRNNDVKLDNRMLDICCLKWAPPPNNNQTKIH